MGRQGGICTAKGGLPFTVCPGCAIPCGAAGVYILQSRPFFHDWKKAGEKG